MQDKIEKWLFDLARWTLIIIIAAVAFYLVCPKYHFSNIMGGPVAQSGKVVAGGVRCNKITGEILFVVTNKVEKRQSTGFEAWQKQNRELGFAPKEHPHIDFIPDQP